MLVSVAYGAPTITSTDTDHKGKLYPGVEWGSNITFSIVTNETIITYHWFVDDINQTNNFDNLTASWIERGQKNVTVWGTNANGSTGLITWRPYVKTEMATGADEVAKAKVDGYDNLINEISIDNPDFEKILYSLSEPYTAVVGDIFFVVLWGLPMIMLWIRQESILIPAMYGLIMGGLLLAFLPASFAATASAMIVLSVMGILYMFYKERR